MFEHFDLVIECDVQVPAQVFRRDVVLVPVRAAVEAALAPAGEIHHRFTQRLRWDCSGVHTNAADAPPALHHQHAFLELGRLHRRAPARGAGPDDDEVKMLRHGRPCLNRTARQDVNIAPCRIGRGPFVLGSDQGE